MRPLANGRRARVGANQLQSSAGCDEGDSQHSDAGDVDRGTSPRARQAQAAPGGVTQPFIGVAARAAADGSIKELVRFLLDLPLGWIVAGMHEHVAKQQLSLHTTTRRPDSMTQPHSAQPISIVLRLKVEPCRTAWRPQSARSSSGNRGVDLPDDDTLFRPQARGLTTLIR